MAVHSSQRRSAVQAVLLAGLILVASGCHEHGSIEVTGLTFKGVTAFKASRLKAALATKESGWLPWGTKKYFSREQFDADLRRIEAFYHDRGYPDARVTSFDVALNDAQDKVHLTLEVSEGLPVLIEEVRFSGFDGIPADHLGALRHRIGVEVDTPRDRQAIQLGRDRAATELRDHGYPYARVDAIEEPGHAERRAIVVFNATPGTIARFGPMEIAGNASVDDRVIERQLTFKPGELFRVSQLQETQRKLYGLELFQFANVEAIDQEGQPAEVPTRITVAEGKHRRLTIGAGYGTEEKARGEIDWRHVNFFGGGPDRRRAREMVGAQSAASGSSSTNPPCCTATLASG